MDFAKNNSLSRTIPQIIFPIIALCCILVNMVSYIFTGDPLYISALPFKEKRNSGKAIPIRYIPSPSHMNY